MSKKLLWVLKKIKAGPQQPDKGICGNLRTLIGDEKFREVASDLCDMMETWPETSGDRFFPVEKTRAAYVHDAKRGALWENPRRIALLDWLIKELEK